MAQSILVWLMLESEGAVLFGRKKSDRPPFAGAWVLPGGAVPEEETAEETLRRYARDELGVTVREEEFAETLHLSEGGDNYVTNVFEVVAYDGDMRFRSSGDFEEMRWLTPAEARDGRAFDVPAPLRAYVAGAYGASALAEYARQRDAVLERIVAILEADARVGAAWLSGSFGRGEADEWADLDLHVAVKDAYYAAFLAERPSLYAKIGRPVLVQAEMASDSMSGGQFQLVVFEDAIEVDWNVGPVSKALLPLGHQVLIERENIPVMSPSPLAADQRRARAEHEISFFWAMAPIAVRYAGRRETRRAVRQIDLLTHALINLWRLARYPEGPEPFLPATNRVLEPELNGLLPLLGPEITPRDALATIEALCERVVELHPALAAIGVPIPDEMPSEVQRVASIAAAEACSPDPIRRTYR